MKKIIFLVIIFTITISLGGCFKKKTITQEDSKVAQYATMMDWLKSGKGVKCVVKSPEGDMTISTKNNKTKIEGMPYMDMSGEIDPSAGDKPQVGAMLNTEEWIYMWSGDKGTKMNIKEMNKLTGEEEIDPEDYSWESWANDQDDMDVKYECSEIKLSDESFEPPMDVEFTDLTAIMQGMNDLSEDMLKGLGDPSEVPGFDGSQGMNQEDIEAQLEAMMKGAGIEQ